MTIQTAARSEYVLFNGQVAYPPAPAAAQTSPTIVVSEGCTLFLMPEKAGTWYLDGMINGQWLPVSHGSYAALTPIALTFSKDFVVPSSIRLRIINAALSGYIYASLFVYPARVESYDTSVASTLAWSAPAADITWIEIGPSISITTGDLEIGAVELKNAATDDRAKIAVVSSLAESDILVGSHDPTIGISSGAALTSDGSGTIQQYLRSLLKIAGWTDDASIDADAAGTIKGALRGLAKAFFARIPVIGPQTSAASMSVVSPADAVVTIMNGAVMDADRSSTVVDLRGKRYWCVSMAAVSNTHVGGIHVFLGNVNPPVDREYLDGMTFPSSGNAYSQTLMIDTGGASYGYVKYVFGSGTGALTITSQTLA